jgi:threonylcarbamoyladenosine tRNA methylthiotransferase MtaB
MKFSIITFGCRVNQADSLQIEDALRARGAENVAAHEADVLIVNTCSVTASADQGARQTIRRVARNNPNIRIFATGCYATRRPDEISSLPNVVRVIDNQSKAVLTDFLDKEIEQSTSDRYGNGEGACGATLQPGVGGRTALTLRVQTGCNETCSYCIIPKTRGQGQSLALSRVLDQVKRGVDAGYKEIVITGVHLGSYGHDLQDGTTLLTLLRALADWPENVLFRISSLEPMDCTSDIVRLVAESRRLAPHFHLPLQHGCDQLLRAMQRPYSTSFYKQLIEEIHQYIPDASIGTDIIVGFPGENVNHFSQTITLLESLPLSHVHVFPYSDRLGTTATQLPDKVKGVDIRSRGRAVREVGERLTRQFQESQIGKTRRALTLADGSRAVTDNYLKVKLNRLRSRNEWVAITVTGKTGALHGVEPSENISN